MAHIAILWGTARKGAKSEQAFNYVVQQVKRLGHEVTALKAADLVTGHTPTRREGIPEQIKPRQEAIVSADGIIIVSPEYNHGYPGELKLVLDSLYPEYKDKRVALCGVSKNIFGGARMVEMLLPVLHELQMITVHTVVYFPGIETLFDEHNIPNDPAYPDRIKKLVDDLLHQ